MNFHLECELDADLPPLHDAAAKNDVKQLTNLLSQDGINANLLDKSEKGKNRTALHVAAIENVGSSHFEVIEILLNNGADPNANDTYEDGLTPLWYVLKNCELNILNLFLKFKADLHVRNDTQESILTRAIRNIRNLDVLRFLVQDIGLDINDRDDEGSIPLHHAAFYNKKDSHYQVLEYLLENGADVNARDDNGQTPLYDLARRGNCRVFDLFLKYKADVHVVCNRGFNILSVFNNENSDPQLLQKLIDDFGLDVNHLNKDKQTPLHYIVNQIDENLMKVEVIKCLLINGGDINAPDKDGETPLIRIVRHIGEIFDEEDLSENLDYFDLLIDQTDFSVVCKNEHIFSYNYDRRFSELLWKCNLKHLAKLKFLSIPVHPIILKTIENHFDYEDYFSKCTRELEVMSSTKPQNLWITYFNLLVDSRRKLKNYAANEDLLQDYKSNDWLNMFPIYGASIKKNFEKGLKRRELFDKSSILLSDCLPVFNCTHLIIKDIFDCVLSKKDLSLFCKCRFSP